MNFPYANLPDYQVWKRTVASPDVGFPLARFSIDRGTRIASAGSCFASNIAERLRSSGFAYLVTEAGPLWQSPEWLQAHRYGSYSARFGDVYTTTQLLQLGKRAVGMFAPREAPWTSRGHFIDPFRPLIEPNGFESVDALISDRVKHLAAVHRMLQESEVLILTLGLTEGWFCAADDAALPLCPGAGVGVFDSGHYYYKNIGIDENVDNLQDFMDIAWSLNPELRFILTVSPVPLAATMEPRHVASSTVWSKSVLRIAAEELKARDERVEYFPAYEIVIGGGDGTTGFEQDRRTVTTGAVDRVMSAFFSTFTAEQPLPVVTLHTSTPFDRVDEPCGEDYFMNYLEDQRRTF